MTIITSNREKLIFIVALVAIVSIIVYVMDSLVSPQTHDKECVNYHSKNLIIMDNPNGVCNWLVGKLLGNGSGFHIAAYSSGPFKLTEKFVLTKVQ